MSTLSWQAGTAAGSFLTGTTIQGLITVNYPKYDPKDWQGTLLIFAMVLIIYIFNIWGARVLPMFQNVLLMLHVFGFSALIIILWVVGRAQPAKAVFTEFSNGGGWSSMGLSLMVGQISAVFGCICVFPRSPAIVKTDVLTKSVGSDAAAHMSEEVKDAGITVPRAIVWSYVVNGIMGVVLLVTYLSCIASVDDALNDPTGYPFLYVFQQSMSNGATTALTTLILVIVIASNIAFNVSTSRQTFAFARDKGLPFAKWIAHVCKRHLHLFSLPLLLD